MIRPRSAADVVACVQYAAEKHIPVHARGAGSGVAGESLGPGLVVDFSKFLRRIVDFDSEQVCVQPGMVHERLNAQLRPRGRLFGPDPANSDVTTVGGMIAVDASGSRWLKYGSVRRHVKSLQVVLADGQLLEFDRVSLAEGAGADCAPAQTRTGRSPGGPAGGAGRRDSSQPAQGPALPLRLQPGRHTHG